MPPPEEYRQRLESWRVIQTTAERTSRQLGNARLASGIAGVAVVGASIGMTLFSPWWLVVPLIVFVALAIRHDTVDKRRSAATRAIAFYERALGRVENRWIGHGRAGEQFRDPKHLYADDLDLFGPASLFELLSDARTSAGERALAGWLKAPSDLPSVLTRQEAVAELRSRLDLREEFALIGEDIRAAIDDRAMAKWGERPALRFFPGARPIALALSIAALVTILLWLGQILSLQPFLFVVLAELIFGLSVRAAVLEAAEGASTPARELRLLGLLLERLEKETFQAPHLVKLTRALDAKGLTASAEIRRLARLVDQLDSARNQFFKPLAAPLLWISQFAMAVEAWRQTSGPNIAQWIAAVGEFEALCSLAAFAYERPEAIFPDLLESNQPDFEAEGLRHPLIDPREAIANDVRLGTGPNGDAASLWIVSGSNMSGKSTLLRAVGVNAVLAWAGAPVPCTRLRLSSLRIGASIRVNDSLADHRSRFYAEISRLREIVDLAKAGLPTLFLLDELLSGTNSHDRRIGAAGLIHSLVERGAIGMVTTHDLALAEITGVLGARARNVHFEDHLEGGEIRFDYHLRPGVVERSNALELMRAVGLDV